MRTWDGYCVGSFSMTADHKRLVFLKQAKYVSSYLAELVSDGKRLEGLRRFPQAEGSEHAGSFTPDSKAIIFGSERSGTPGIYREGLDDPSAELLMLDPAGIRGPYSTPDGKWILYFQQTGRPAALGPEPVMRVPASGGTPQQLFISKAWSIMTCGLYPSSMCAILEPTDDGKQVVATAIDPEKGRGPELLRFDVFNRQWDTEISPDGRRIATTKSTDPKIYIYSLRGDPPKEISVKGRSNILSVNWTADGKGFYASSSTRIGIALLHIDLQGNVHTLWENIGATYETLAFPSPDRRHLILQGWSARANLWMLENF